MNKYSKRSELNLSQCHSDLRLICQCLLHKFDHSVLCGYRGEEEQNKAYANGHSDKQFPNSKHNQNPSIAVDIAPYPRDPNKESDKIKFGVMAGWLLCIADDLLHKGLIYHEIRWGGDWNGNGIFSDQTLFDFGHFELIAL